MKNQVKKFEVGKVYFFKVYDENGWDYSVHKIQIKSRVGDKIKYFDATPGVWSPVDSDMVYMYNNVECFTIKFHGMEYMVHANNCVVES